MNNFFNFPRGELSDFAVRNRSSDEKLRQPVVSMEARRHYELLWRFWGNAPGSMSETSRILSAIKRGDPSAASQLLPLVYEELRRLAAQDHPFSGIGSAAKHDLSLKAEAK